MIGKTLAHYRITAAIGAGGMGEVYRATDTRLDRDVALKVLPAEMAASPERRERFRREAKALAALDHPGVVSVYSVEEADGVHFLTMQLVAGQSIDELIPAGGAPVERILEIGEALADALAAAHAKGIVHRDLKPANVMVTEEGRVKVLDFGLARMTAPADVEDDSALPTMLQTREGIVMGTVPYMSPEQVAGRTVDHRTDLFSLGVMLYEMATGLRPFTGASEAELMSAILRDVPRPPSQQRGDLPPELAAVIESCLHKSVDDRPQSARALAELLRAVPRRSPPSPAEAETATRVVSPPGTAAPASQTGEGFWIAVLPFRHTGTSDDLAALAEGLTEEILTWLSRFSYLKVVAGSSTERFAEQRVDVRSAATEVGARYVIDGTLRQAGTKLRLTARLLDMTTGAHLWAENYERTFSPEALFDLQDDLVPRIVSTIGDMHGVLARSMSESLRGRPPEQLTPYEAVLRGTSYFERVSAEELASARVALERAVQKAPDYADAWALLALLCAQDHGQGFQVLEDPLASAAAAAQRAVEVGPSNHLAHFSQAQVLFFQRELLSFRNAAQRAAELNPMDGTSIAFLGELLIYAGDFERGRELAARAKRLNPNHPGWYWYADSWDAYLQGDDRRSLELALKANLPNHWGMHAMAAAAYGQLGERAAAARSVKELLRLRPDLPETASRELQKWWPPEFIDRLIDGWRKAGLEVSVAPPTDPAPTVAEAPAPSGSGPARKDGGFWVAVLPFKYPGAGGDLVSLADGLTEEIVTGLSRFSYLRVLARSSTSRFADSVTDVGAVGREIGARYVMEGSLRQAGRRLRVSVQLVDASTGAHLWAESYDRSFDSEQLFELQDDLVARIVSTCADHFGVLARAISEAVRAKPVDEITPYEALMRGFGYHFRLDPEEHAQAREALERAVEQAPSNADCQAMLAWVYAHEHAHDFNPRPGSLDRALEAARRAVDLAPSNHLAQQVLAVAFFFRKETASCLSACERALALNPLDGSNEAIFLTWFAGEWERGCSLIRRAMELNPHHPRWYGAVLALDEYRRGDYRAAVDAALESNAFDLFWTYWLLAAAHGQLGETEAAAKALEELFALKEDFPRTGRALLDKWFLPELVEHFADGLRKAGLELETAGPGPASL